jgi:hypothetical protein
MATIRVKGHKRGGVSVKAHTREVGGGMSKARRAKEAFESHRQPRGNVKLFSVATKGSTAVVSSGLRGLVVASDGKKGPRVRGAGAFPGIRAPGSRELAARRRRRNRRGL